MLVAQKFFLCKHKHLVHFIFWTIRNPYYQQVDVGNSSANITTKFPLAEFGIIEKTMVFFSGNTLSVTDKTE